MVSKLYDEFGMPKSGREWILRPAQEEALNDLANREKGDVSLLYCPTGSGKSLISYKSPRDSFIITKTFQLTQKYKNDFHDMVEIKGANNFSCNKQILDTKCSDCNQPKRCFYAKIQIPNCEFPSSFYSAIITNKTLINSSYFFKAAW
ncbi:MAG: hypothetical protein LBT10_08300 [Methanobrevibacter sp.]|nr:hypothetical protein [Methanobrevibacter sp.]